MKFLRFSAKKTNFRFLRRQNFDFFAENNFKIVKYLSTWFTNARARILRRRNRRGKRPSKTVENCSRVQRSAVPPGRHGKRKVLALASACGSAATVTSKMRACVPLKGVRGQMQTRRHVVARKCHRLERARTIANPANIESLVRQLGRMRMSATLPLPARPRAATRAATCTAAQAVRAAILMA